MGAGMGNNQVGDNLSSAFTSPICLRWGLVILSPLSWSADKKVRTSSWREARQPEMREGKDRRHRHSPWLGTLQPFTWKSTPNGSSPLPRKRMEKCPCFHLLLGRSSGIMPLCKWKAFSIHGRDPKYPHSRNRICPIHPALLFSPRAREFCAWKNKQNPTPFFLRACGKLPTQVEACVHQPNCPITALHQWLHKLLC